MSTLETILTRMMSDSAFADSLFVDAEKALAGYNLSAEDMSKFKGLSRTQFADMALGNRLSLGGPSDPQDSPAGSGNHNETALSA